MPRYYFHIRNEGSLEKDPEGAEFASLEDAYKEAMQAAREIVAQKVLADDPIDKQCFEITAEDGIVLGTLPLRSVVRLS